MKKILALFVTLLLTVCVYACDIPDGYTYRQEVQVYEKDGEAKKVAASAYQSSNACDAYGVCFKINYESSSNWYYVSKSDKDGYKYMFWYYGRPMYFNM